MKQPLTLETVEIQIKKLGDRVDSLGRKVSDLTRQIETLDQDRAILEDIQRAIRSLEESNRLNKEHIDTIFKDLKIEVKVQGARTEDTVSGQLGELAESMDKKKVVVVKEGLFAKLRKKLERR